MVVIGTCLQFSLIQLFIQLSFLIVHSLKVVTGKCNRNISIFYNISIGVIDFT